MEKKELATRIRKFLETYARKDSEGEWTCPDAYQLEMCADLLEQDQTISRIPWSEWGSGGYRPYTSREGQKEHEFLLEEIRKIIV